MMTEKVKAKINKRIEKYVELGYIGRLTESWDCDNYQSRDDGSLTATLTRTCKTKPGRDAPDHICDALGYVIYREKILIPKDGRKNIEFIKAL
jgi:hypothetical protein